MSSITTINAGDLITNSRADINNNFSALNTDKIETSVLDTDTTLAANSNSKVPTQAAVKAYVDAGGNVNASETTKGIVEIATQSQVNAGTAVGETGASLVVTPATLGGLKRVRNVYDLADSPATWTKDVGLVYVEVEIWGGGGAGGNAGGSTSRGSGGGGGGYNKKTFLASELGATETVTVGGSATNSTFGSLLTGYRGGQGLSNFGAGTYFGGGGGGQLGAGGDGGDGVYGEPGSPGFPSVGYGPGSTEPTLPNPSIKNGIWGGGGGTAGTNPGGASVYGGGGGGGAGGGAGGASVLGGAGGAGNASGTGSAGSVPGGGGGSGTSGGGSGGAGRVIVTEYYV